MSGHFGVAVFHPKTEVNVGSLWRTADLLGASYMATIGNRYKPQASDTMKSWRNIPLWRFDDFESFREVMPVEARLIAVELADGAIPMAKFSHPAQACYLLGAEDHGIPPAILRRCHATVVLPGAYSMNLACAGSIVIYDRLAKASPLSVDGTATVRGRYSDCTPVVSPAFPVCSK